MHPVCLMEHLNHPCYAMLDNFFYLQEIASVYVFRFLVFAVRTDSKLRVQEFLAVFRKRGGGGIIDYNSLEDQNGVS